MGDEHVLISVKDELMVNKNYHVGVAGLIPDMGHVRDNVRVLDKSEFLAYIKKELKLSNYKAKTVLEVFIVGELLLEDKEDKNILYAPNIESNFIRILKTTVRYCINNLSDLAFKVYCYLLNKYNMHIYYDHTDNYFFSVNELLRKMGYNDRSAKSHRMINETLITLKKLKLIDYNQESVGRPGKHGVYHELYKVNEYSSVQKEAIVDTVKSIKQIENKDIVEDAVMFGMTDQLKNNELVGEAKEVVTTNWSQLKERNK